MSYAVVWITDMTPAISRTASRRGPSSSAGNMLPPSALFGSVKKDCSLRACAVLMMSVLLEMALIGSEDSTAPNSPAHRASD